MINETIRDETRRKLGCGSAAYYAYVDKVRQRYGNTIGRDAAAYVLAAEKGVDLARHLSSSTCDRIRRIRSEQPLASVAGSGKGTQSDTRAEGRGKASAAPRGDKQCSGRPRDVVDCMGLHEDVARVARKLFVNGHYSEAVEKALKLFDNAVKSKAGKPRHNGKELYGASLMTTVFSRDKPILRINDLDDESDKDEQQGYMQIAQGAMTGLRNPRVHTTESQDDATQALRLLGLVSYLMTKLGGAKRMRRRRTPVP